MSIFTRKPKLAHQLTATQSDHSIIYHCSVCSRDFYSATSVKERGEYCCGKRCYSERNLSSSIATDRETIPSWLKQEDEIKATGRAIRKGQTPVAYLHYELVTMAYGGFTGYDALYDIRECRELDGAIPLPAFE